MRTRGRLGLLGLVLWASPALAQAQGFFASGEVGYFDLTSAKRSAKAIFGSSGGLVAGGTLGYDLGPRFFISGTVRYFKKSGERAFVDPATDAVFPLGHPLNARVIPLYALLGYRFATRSALHPYLGAGVGLTLYHETSDVAGVTDEDNQSKPSGDLVAGLDLGRSSLRFGVEAQFSFAPSVLGQGGVSAVYGESNLGGLTVVGKIVFGHTRE